MRDRIQSLIEDHHKRYLKKKKEKSIIVIQKVGWEYWSSYVCVVRFNSRLSDQLIVQHYTVLYLIKL